MYDWYVEHGYSEDGVEIERAFEPARLREWLKRNYISEDEGFDEVTFENFISDYVHFLSWLAKNAHCNNLSEIEDYYDDDELEAYKQYKTYA